MDTLPSTEALLNELSSLGGEPGDRPSMYRARHVVFALRNRDTPWEAIGDALGRTTRQVIDRWSEQVTAMTAEAAEIEQVSTEICQILGAMTDEQWAKVAPSLPSVLPGVLSID